MAFPDFRETGPRPVGKGGATGVGQRVRRLEFDTLLNNVNNTDMEVQNTYIRWPRRLTVQF